MRRIATTADDPLAQMLVGGIVCMDVRDPQRPREVLVRKGRALSITDLDRMAVIGRVPIVVMLADDGVGRFSERRKFAHEQNLAVLVDR